MLALDCRLEFGMKFLLIVSVLCLSATASAQISKTPETSYVIVPAQSIFLAIAAQPDCPLRIEDAQLLMPVGKGRAQYRYKLSNKGDKPINYFTVVFWSAEGTGGTLGGPPPWDGRVTDRLLYPGESVRVGQYDLPIVPLDSMLQERLKLSGKMQTVVILLVDQITFADGSKYDAQAASKSLIDFFVDRSN
jgi:hypothetical protein